MDLTKIASTLETTEEIASKAWPARELSTPAERLECSQIKARAMIAYLKRSIAE